MSKFVFGVLLLVCAVQTCLADCRISIISGERTIADINAEPDDNKLPRVKTIEADALSFHLTFSECAPGSLLEETVVEAKTGLLNDPAGPEAPDTHTLTIQEGEDSATAKIKCRAGGPDVVLVLIKPLPSTTALKIVSDVKTISRESKHSEHYVELELSGDVITPGKFAISTRDTQLATGTTEMPWCRLAITYEDGSRVKRPASVDVSTIDSEHKLQEGTGSGYEVVKPKFKVAVHQLSHLADTVTITLVRTIDIDDATLAHFTRVKLDLQRSPWIALDNGKPATHVMFWNTAGSHHGADRRSLFADVVDLVGASDVQPISNPYTLPHGATVQDLFLQDSAEFGCELHGDACYPLPLALSAKARSDRVLYSSSVKAALIFEKPIRLSELDQPGHAGGNIEVSPPFSGAPYGVILIGKSDTIDLRNQPADVIQFLRLQGQQRVELVELTGIGGGHIDEVVSFVPLEPVAEAEEEERTSVSGAAKFKILMPSLSLAMSILYAQEQTEDGTFLKASEADQADQHVVDHFVKVFRDAGVASCRGLPSDCLPFQLKFSDVNPRLFTRSAGAVEAGDAKCFDTLTAEGLLEGRDEDCRLRLAEGLRPIEMKLREIKAHVHRIFGAAAHIIDIPVWFQPSGMPAVPNMVNSLVFANSDGVVHHVVADPWVQAFKNYFEAVLPATDNRKIRFVNDIYYHIAQGEVHCATNAIRGMPVE
eukprot:GILK01006205.1.p1 GENE.GILK01006205.1~~GILK01006205.1.p1  ORF type:complete len:725 (+),score=81.92 GILK01006205.1:46-2175(+)